MTNEDVETGFRVINGKLTLTTLTAMLTVCLLSVVNGCTLAYTSPALVDIDQNRNPFHLTTNWQSWIASGCCIGVFFSGLLGGVLLDRFGRKFTMVMVVLPYTFGWVLMTAARSAAFLFVTRIITGMCWNVLLVAVPMYLSEISPTSVRGALIAVYYMTYVVGVQLTYLCGIWLPWTWLAIVPVAILTAAMLFLVFLPESPHWLLAHGYPEAAAEALTWFRGVDDVRDELEEIQRKATETMHQVGWRHLTEKSVYKPLFIICVVYVVQVFSGVDYVFLFTVTIFIRSGTSIDPFVQTALVGMANLGGSLVATWTLDRIGRRPSLLWSAVATALCNSALGAYYKVREEDARFAESYLYWLPLTCLVLFQVCYTLGLHSVPAALTAEVLPLRARGLGGGIAYVVMGVAMFFETRFSLPLSQTWVHDYGVFWFFAVVLYLGSIFVFLFVPETKGKTLESIQEMFE